MKAPRLLLTIGTLLTLLVGSLPALAHARPVTVLLGTPVLSLTQTVSAEPLLGGQIGFTLTVRNNGATPVTDKGYNLTITDTLPSGLSFASADPPPSLVAVQADGTTRVVWDNLADVEVHEALEIALTTTLSGGLTVADTRLNQVSAQVNTAPDNSGPWVATTSSLSWKPQAVDLDLVAVPSTRVAQATGAGELTGAPGARAGADWPFTYRVTVRNNNVGASSAVVARVTLPPGVAYLGSPTMSANSAISATPAISLTADGSLQLTWALGTLTTARYADPVLISFAAAVPYAFRTLTDTAALAGPFAGPMSGLPIPEDTALPATYEASAIYSGVASADGTSSTPADDAPATVRAAYLTIAKSATPTTVGIGTSITFTLDLVVSEYYSATNVVISDTLPDGLSYEQGSADRVPTTIAPNTPGVGQTVLSWELPAAETGPGVQRTITFRAVVDSTYEAAPNKGQPIVSGDQLTNRVKVAGDWQAIPDLTRLGATTPDEAQSTVGTTMPSFSKEVRDPVTGAWTTRAAAFTGDTLRFRLRYNSAANLDAKAIIIRDFLPRGMSYVPDSAAHTLTGTYSDGPSCVAAPSAPTIGTLSGLQYLEWHLCNAALGSTWEVTIDAQLGDIPNLQPGWIVANFGKLSGMNTPGAAYSLRQSATLDYLAPELQLTKTANPRTNLIGGSIVTYTIKVTNSGKATAYNLAVIDTVPANLVIAASGGSATPQASSYSTTAGSPVTGAGGTLTWATVASLAVNASETFTYQATVPDGLAAGTSMNNLASVAYNSRADNKGHQWAATTVLADANTDDETVYIKGVTASLSVTPATVTIGEIARWTVTGSVASGTVAYWPVVQINSLPDGLVALTGGESVVGATLDTAHHTPNPFGNGARELRFFLQTLDNTAGTVPLTFTISFDSLVTGYRVGSPTTLLWNQCCLSTVATSAYVGWYDSTSGYNNLGYAYHGIETNRVTRRSSKATANLTIAQPNLIVGYHADQTQVGANDTVTFIAQVTNLGNSIAHNVALTDTLPSGVRFVASLGSAVAYPPGFPAQTDVFTDTNSANASALTYELEQLHVGATWSVTFTAHVDPTIGASLDLTSSVRLATYDTRPGTPPDRNGDSIADEWRYNGPEALVTLFTPRASLAKVAVVDGELTYGAPLSYTLTLPAAPINATIYTAQVSDAVDARLRLDGVDGGSATLNSVSASFVSIPPGEQRSVTIRATLPLASTARDGDVISNTATLVHRDGTLTSNTVANTIVAPALTVAAMADAAELHDGEVMTFTLTVGNVGHGMAVNPNLALTLPAALSLVAGSVRLNDAPFADPSAGVWALPTLTGDTSHRVSFLTVASGITAGSPYVLEGSATGQDSLGATIPADNRVRVPADDDPDDRARVTTYGPLNWHQDSTFVVYEDLKKVGWSDWDYNDFVTRVDIERGLDSAGNLAAVRMSYEALARGAGYDHSFLQRLPVVGGGAARVVVRDGAGALVLSRDLSFGEDANFEIFTHTRTALPPLAGWLQTNTPVAQKVAVPGYKAVLTVLLTQASANPADALPPLPWDPYLKVYNTGQVVHLVGPGRLDNTQRVNNVYDRTSPLVGYDLPLAQAFPVAWHWPIEYIGIWQAYPQFTRYIMTAGREQAQWYELSAGVASRIWAGTPATGSLVEPQAATVGNSRYFGGPQVADLNGDGQVEIIVGNLTANQVEVYDTLLRPVAGWPQTTGGGIKAAVTVADLNGDGHLELTTGAEDGRLYAWHADGTALPGWPVRLGDDPTTDYRILATPAVGDINGDGSPEVVVPLADGQLYARRADGTALWSASLGGQPDLFGSQVVNSSPRLADLDGDGHLEIVIGSSDGQMYVFNGDGTQRWAYQTGDMILGAPVVADFISARAGLEVAVGSGDGYIYLLGADGSLLWRRVTRWTIRSTPTAADLNADGQPELVVGADDGRVYAWDSSGTALPGWPQTAGAPVFASPVVGDVDGDGQPEVVAGADDGQIFAWKTNGTMVTGWPHLTTAAVKGTPVLVNLDRDPALELVLTDLDGGLTNVGAPRIKFMPLVWR